MADRKFAFESDEVSVAFIVSDGLGDSIISKKVLDAVIELAPRCVVDIFFTHESHKAFVDAFYCGIKNLNLILPHNELYKKIFQKYDAALHVRGSWPIILDYANVPRLKALAPQLLQAAVKISEYNKANLYDFGSVNGARLRARMISRILNKNCYDMLSCDGALPIRDSKVDIPLLPEYKPAFDALKLGKYITIYSDINRNSTPPKIKTWPMHYLVEYVARMKKRFPAVEIVQCGGADDLEIENADRHFLNVDLELTKHILANSLLHVGCEGGLVHLATALGTKCLVLFGNTDVHFYGYNQNINIASEVCCPCQDIWGNAVSTYCPRAKEPPCMLSHTPQLVCEVTCNYLKNKA